MRTLFFALFLSLLFPLQGEIREAEHFSDILSVVDKNTLILLDIDDTLLIPVQTLGCDVWYEYRIAQHRHEGFSLDDAIEKALAEWEAVRHLTQMEIVEPGTEQIVKKLQEEGYQVMALTTQGAALATRTFQQLLSLGIDLRSSAPCKHDVYFCQGAHGILYRNGILFTSGQRKGDALFQLCEQIGYTPEKIVFINDKSRHLQDVETASQAHAVPFLGLRYAYSDARKASFVSEIADLQFSKSTFTHLISDEEAKTLLSLPTQ